jgi:hypothetical protein
VTCPGKTKQAPPVHIGPFKDVKPPGRRVARSQLYWIRKYRIMPGTVVQRQIDVFRELIEINDIVCIAEDCDGHRS